MTCIEKLKIAGIALAASVLTVSPSVAFTPNAVIGENVEVNRQIICMAQNGYHEARNQPRAGKIAVMNVVMNRASDPRFPSTPCGVINQRSRSICQFSWVCSGKKRISEISAYNEMVSLASQVYHGRIGDVTNGAKFFHHKSMGARSRNYRIIGAHIFFNR